MSKGTLITIKEARKLLGKEAESLSDEEILEIVNDLQLLAKEQLKKKGVNMSNNSLGIYRWTT
ncbi:MAG: hypothetical protein WDN27_02375 [Candidatus Saccharibacteria bacterium]